MSRKPITVYRVRCGTRIYGGWKASRKDAFLHAWRHGLAYGEPEGPIGLGPLTWIEIGQRKYARSKTVSLDRA